MIVCCGEALIDMVPEDKTDNTFIARPGGCHFNTAIAIGRLEGEVEFFGKIGTDFLGQMLADKLKENNVGTKYTIRSKDQSTLAFASRSIDGSMVYAFYSNGGADRSLSYREIPNSFNKASFLMFGSISMVQEPSKSAVEKVIKKFWNKIIIYLDPNIRPGLILNKKKYLSDLAKWCKYSDIVKVSSDDLEWLFPNIEEGARAYSFIKMGAKLVIETVGSKGARAIYKGQDIFVPSFKIKVKDTIGAGDTFHAALLVKLDSLGIKNSSELESITKSNMIDILRFSQGASAINCTRIGADPPSLEELKKFLKT